MINFFTTVYSSINKNDKIFNIRFYSLIRVIVRNVANFLLPGYLQLTSWVFNYRLGAVQRPGPKIIVSLTTYPARINKLWIVIECVLRQTFLPDKIILWLSKDQFPDLSALPEKLLKLQERGLEIYLCDGDLRSHKKYYYAIKSFPDDILITIDDDIIYRPALVSDLINLNHKFPKAICCDRALKIATNDKGILPYAEWKYVNDAETPSYRFFHTSGGGTLYFPGALSDDVLNEAVFLKYCKDADDIWLNAMAQLNDTQIAKTKRNTIFLPIIYKTNETLASENLYAGKNDAQLMLLREYYINTYNNDPFVNVFR